MNIPEIETQPIEVIKRFQEQKLTDQLHYLQQKSKFYQRLFREQHIDISKIKTLEDLQYIPVTTKSDLQLYNHDFLCVEPHQITDYITTSGTLGEPVTFAATENDLERLAYNEAISFLGAGCTSKDVFQLMTTIDRRFMAGLAYFLGIRKMGASVVRVGNGIPELQVDSIRRFSSTVCIVVPSFLLKIIEYAESQGFDLNKSTLRKAICIGEPLRNTDYSLNTLGQRITEKWNTLSLHSTYASTEMGTSFTECKFGCGGHHHPELIIVELLDDHGRVVAEGEPGEVTVTTLGVEGMPLLRFRTGDICTYDTSPCACGLTTMRLGMVIGRKQQMIKYKGTTLYPPALYDILDNVEGISNYLVEVYTNEIGTDEILIRIGSVRKDEFFEKSIKDRFRAKLRVAPEISFEPPEYIHHIQNPQISRKPIKFFDRRGKNLS
ncbi:MAG: AMP-binding protein [Bacteroidales bacterium]|jgi:phenylacetate-CoA ligase|nr:AMP-binding protein [Bacteroidales bacterium]